MPVPLPPAGETNLRPPDADEVAVISRAVVAAASPPGGLTATQRLLLRAVVHAMTGHAAVLEPPGVEPGSLARALQHRNLEFRSRIVQIMILVGLVLRPLPEAVAERIASYAAEMGVDDGMMSVARRFAEGSLGLAAFDFERNGYTSTWRAADADHLHASIELNRPWDFDVDDPELFGKWQSLEGLPDGSIGRRLTDFYRARGFVYPGRAGSAPPLLAQHDWVHVLADYGTTVESELEVFAFIARANDDVRAFSLLAMVVSLFETGYLQAGAGLFEASPGHLSESGMPERLADAMRRGALCRGSIDFMRTDWFELAALAVDQVRADFGVPPKSEEARRVGSVGPWEPGGISPFQARAGRALADSEGRPYEAYGATLSE